MANWSTRNSTAFVFQMVLLLWTLVLAAWVVFQRMSERDGLFYYGTLTIPGSIALVTLSCYYFLKEPDTTASTDTGSA